MNDELKDDVCPSCSESDLIDVLDEDADVELRRFKSCGHCGATWTDIYRITFVRREYN